MPMTNEEILIAFHSLAIPYLVDACRKLGVPLRTAPVGIMPVKPEMRLAGRAFPARHSGSLDVVLEALELMEPGEVLVVDGGGRTDMACIGDITAAEARRRGLGGFVVWGCHRDTPELRELDVPVFSYGRCPHGPLHTDPRPDDALVAAWFGAHQITQSDVVFADEDGVLFVPYDSVQDVLEKAREVYQTERNQIGEILGGRSIHDQLNFDEYLKRRKEDPTYTFSQHLKRVGGSTGE